MKLQKKKALIIGATGVIGSTIAHAFAQEGARLILSGRNKEKLAILAKEFDHAATYQTDMADQGSVQGLGSFIAEQWGSLDILVACHGTYGEIGPLAESEPDAWFSAIKTNLFGTVLAIRYCLPLLQKSERGKIITFPGGGEGALPNFTSYVASKAAILRLTETLAKERGFENIDINAISPGAVKSGLTAALVQAGEKKAGTDMYQKNVEQMEKGGEDPHKAAELAVFLASSEANGLSGKNISAVWDTWQDIPLHLQEIMSSDIYAMRRIKPKDRGYDW